MKSFEFGAKRNLNRTYTYIFFPSTLYNEFYHDGITDPENVFGYNEVVLDDFGIPRTDQNGDVMYDIVTDGRRGVSFNGNSFSSQNGSNQYETYNGLLASSLNYNRIYYLAPDGTLNRDTGVENQSYHRNDPYVINHPSFNSASQGNYSGLNKKQEFFSPIYGNDTYSIDLNFPTDEFHIARMTDPLNSQVKKFINGSQSDLFSAEENDNYGYKTRYEEQFQKRRQYRNDRFGFWTSFYDREDSNNMNLIPSDFTGGSRYLPIKITVNGNLTPDTLSEILPTLLNASFDNNGYFDFTSNVWTYNLNSASTYTTAVNGFTAKDVDNIFDIMQNPDSYDENGVIRLYPVFSNGKNTTTKNLNEGARDAIKAEYVYKNNVPTVEKATINTKLTYSSDTCSDKYSFQYDAWPGPVIEDWRTAHYDVNYAVLKNLELKKNYYESITFYICPSYDREFSGTWYQQFTITSAQIDDFIDGYGEGLYTFYFFIGNNSDYNTRDFPKEKTQEWQNLSAIGNYAVSADSAFTQLREKNLLTYSNIGSGDYYKDMCNSLDLKSSYQERPIALYLEKVTNMRLVSNIDIKEDEKGVPTADQDWNAIDESIHNGMINADNFVIASGVETYNKDDNGNQIESTKRTITSPYVYIIQNADFRYVNHLYFQIRFSNQYINDSLHVVTNFDDYGNDKNLGGLSIPNNYVSYEVADGVTIELYSQNTIVDKSEDMFIQNANATGTIKNSDGSTTTIERQGFKLKDFYSRGVYDIMLVSNGSYQRPNGNTVRVYNMYINRHTNSFIKLFDENPGTFEFKVSDEESKTFVSHKQTGDDLITGEPQGSYTKKTLIWEGQTYLGEMLTTNENDVKNPNVTFLKALNDYFNLTTDNKIARTYPIIDAVTGQTIAYYEYSGSSTTGRIFNASGSTDGNNPVDLFMILKNYVLYIGNPIQP